MPKARTSLVFKGPANPSGRIRKPPTSIVLDSVPRQVSTTRVVKKRKKASRSAVPPDTTHQEDPDETRVPQETVPDRTKGKRKAVETPESEDPSPKGSTNTLTLACSPPPILTSPQPKEGPHVRNFETSIARSTFEKSWKPLCAKSRQELVDVAKDIESDMLSSLPRGMSTTVFQRLICDYFDALTTHLDEVRVPPFPATLKSRSAKDPSSSKDFVATTLLSPGAVRNKLETLKANLEKEQKIVTELEQAGSNLPAERGVEESPTGSRHRTRGEHEADNVDIVVSPARKRKKTVTIDVSAARPSNTAANRVKSQARIKSTDPSRSATARSRSILIPANVHPITTFDGSDDFDTFPLPPPRIQPRAKSATRPTSTMTTTKVQRADVEEIVPSRKKKRPSLAGKKNSKALIEERNKISQDR